MVDGYTLAIHRSLTEPILMAGAPRGAAILIGTLAAAVGLGLQMWLPGLLIWTIGHGSAVYLARKDPKFLEVGMRCLKQPRYFAC